ncbi:MAG: hypothetical protein M0C28_26185 [Candidatus Moduliflexus flocculans]|nr:hypothetical protein [Candidatus Moduliflexus flocculans]
MRPRPKRNSGASESCGHIFLLRADRVHRRRHLERQLPDGRAAPVNTSSKAASLTPK